MAGSLADPAGAGTFVAGISWIQGTLLGSVALAIATLAIAGVGFMMLTGRVEIRRGATVIFGAFLLFGSPVIASGFMALLLGTTTVASTRPVSAEPPPPTPPQVIPPANYDPYAGASVTR